MRLCEAGHRPERPQSVSVFRHALLCGPDVIAGEVHMLPAERRQMGQKMIGHILGLAQGGDGRLQISRVPEDDGGDKQVEAGGAVLLVLVGSVADFAEPMDEDRAGQAVAGLALVEFLAGRAPQFGIVDPVEREQRAFQPPEFAQRGGDAVLARDRRRAGA